jgi:hypothetical protein
MEGLSLDKAISIVEKLKAGEAVPAVNVNGTEYMPKLTVKFISGLASEINNGKLLVPGNDKIPSVRNIQGNKLDFPFLVIGKRMRFDSTTGAAVTAATGKYRDEAPVYFDNGEVTVKQDGEQTVPISIIANSYAATSNKDDFFDVVPYLIRPEKEFSIVTDCAGNAPADTAWRFEMLGVEFVKAK